MKRFFISASCAFLAFASSLHAQEQTQAIDVTGPASANITWDTVSGRSYFLQYSPDLQNWFYHTSIDYADGSVPQLSKGITANSEKLFVRLQYADIPITGSVDDADFDLDGISNANEIKEGGSGTSPFSYSSMNDGFSDYERDSNSNNLRDGWELKNAASLGELKPHEDDDGDGLSNLEESILGTIPTSKNTDGDSFDDGEDAMPTERLINWKKSPTTKYLVMDLGVLDISSFGDWLLNCRGDVTSSNKYYNALTQTWVDLPDSPIQEIEEKYSASDIAVTSITETGKVVGYYSYLYEDPEFVYAYSIKEVPFEWSPTRGFKDYKSTHECEISDLSDTSARILASEHAGKHYGVITRYRDFESTLAQDEPPCDPPPNQSGDEFFPEYYYETLALWNDGTSSNLGHRDDQTISILGASKEGHLLWSSEPGLYSERTHGSIYLDGEELAKEPYPNGEPVSIARTTLPNYESPLLGGLQGVWSNWTGSWSVVPLYTDYDKASLVAGEVKAITDQGVFLIDNSSFWQNGVSSSIQSLILNEPVSSALAHDMTQEGLLALTATKSSTSSKHVFLGLPFQMAPDVLPVNSDFDEGRVDQATGYAIADCDDVAGVDPITGAGNTHIELEAKRNHLDGNHALGDRIVEDMHKGWFGVAPNLLDDSFWQGATVTLRKVDKIDETTGYKESGQVRFYAKWGENYVGITPYDFQSLTPVNLTQGGINGQNGVGVYPLPSSIPDDVEFYMEGVRSGKITLEWRYQKGSVDISHEQTFLVTTQQSSEKWRKEVVYQIRLQTLAKTGKEVDLDKYIVSNGFRNTRSSTPPEYDNRLRVKAIYDFYQQMFDTHREQYLWSGMAKVAAAPIYAGMSDLTTMWSFYSLVQQRDPAVEVLIEALLLDGQKTIFHDKSWALRAHHASGIYAIYHVEDTETEISATDYAAWELIDRGININDENSTARIKDGNARLLLREQRDVVQSNYNVISNIWMIQPDFTGGVLSWLLGFERVAENASGRANVGDWLSANSKKNPIPDGPGFHDTVPNGRIDSFSDRWSWTSNSQNGMLQIWVGDSQSVSGYGAARRLSENNKPITNAATPYSFDPAGLP